MSTRVDLSPAIYPAECLRETIGAYAGFCSVRVVSETPAECSVEILPSAGVDDEKQLVREFLNYLLDVSLEKHLAGFQESHGTDRVSAA